MAGPDAEMPDEMFFIDFRLSLLEPGFLKLVF